MSFALPHYSAQRFLLVGAVCSMLMFGVCVVQAQTTTDGSSTDSGSQTTSGSTITLSNSTGASTFNVLTVAGSGATTSVLDTSGLLISTVNYTNIAGTSLFSGSTATTGSSTTTTTDTGSSNAILVAPPLNTNGLIITSGSTLMLYDSNTTSTSSTISGVLTNTSSSNTTTTLDLGTSNGILVADPLNASRLTFTNASTLTLYNSNTASTGLMILGGVSSTPSLIKTGTGTLTLNGSLQFQGLPTVTAAGTTLSLTSAGTQTLTSNNVYTGAVIVNGATILTNGNALGTISYSGTTLLSLTSGGTINLTALSSSGLALALGDATVSGGTVVSLTTTSSTSQTVSSTAIRVAALGSVPVGKTPASTSFASSAVALLGVGSLGGQSVTERGVVYSLTSVNSSPTLDDTGVVKVVNAGLLESSGGFSLTAAGLAANTKYSYRVYAIDSTGATYLSQPSTFTTPTVLQNWRQTFFGSTNATSNAADNADPDADGVPNLVEFATGKNPTSPNAAAAAVSHSGSDLEYSYTRSLDALNSGTTFIVEWNDTLNPSQWSSAGVSEVVVSDDGTVQQVKAAVPAGSTGRRFMRLKVVPPAQ